ncbi:hypothetical protein A9K75_06530 [Campylobacter fetus subsp. testudinum]|uniref:hypothetical protein n=1 Tax=Campylobacter fetus TaxID=196 RepID=UPI000818B623|nr:hypothetical protein [Campylobacter fetus]OCR99521.1 hypothetical protein A9K75_06530 [Campylobacter fetus subsp. testudinum]
MINGTEYQHANKIKYSIENMGKKRFFDYVIKNFGTDHTRKKQREWLRKNWLGNKLSRKSKFRDFLILQGTNFLNDETNLSLFHATIVLFYANEQDYAKFLLAKDSLEKQGIFCICPQETKLNKEAMTYFIDSFVEMFNIVVIVGDTLKYKNQFHNNAKLLSYKQGIYHEVLRIRNNS